MSSRKFKARDRATLKNTRGGLVERNETTGAEIPIGKREAELDLRGGGTAEHETFSQVGKTFSNRNNRKQIYNQPETAPIPPTNTNAAFSAGMPTLPQPAAAQPAQSGTQYNKTPTSNPPKPIKQAKGGTLSKTQQCANVNPSNSAAQYHTKPERHQPVKTASTTSESAELTNDTALSANNAPSKATDNKTSLRLSTDTNDRLKFKQDESAQTSQSKRKPQPEVNSANEKADNTPAKAMDTAKTYKTSTANQPAKDGKLKFKSDEAAPKTPSARHGRSFGKAQAQAERAAAKLEKAQNNLPSKRKLVKASITDEETGAVSQRLKFEKMPVPQSEHIKGAKLLRTAKAAGNALILNAHRKLYQVEHENTGIKAAHRAEMTAEFGIRTALRFHKTAPYRKAAKLERASARKSTNLDYRKAISENPRLQSSIITRTLQKRKIKKEYAKAAHEAQKAANKAKQAGSAIAKAGKSIGSAAAKNPKTLAIAAVAMLSLFSVVSLAGMFGSVGSGGIGGIVSSTYLAADADILGAEAAYAAIEAELHNKLDSYAALNPGYDQYKYELDEIWHDPYSLISLLSALHEGAWTLDGVQATLEMLFAQQYSLTETVTTETRTRTETATVTDPETGISTDVENKFTYSYTICTVKLENFNLSHLPVYIMDEQGLSRYAVLMMTLGNRPDMFPSSAYPDASYHKDYGRHEIPPEYLDDETFAAIIGEAEKWLGMPYVWGGSCPATSFDCSGYVSWVLNHSGWNVGRLGARALYSISTPVTARDARPGDLIFFHSTYKTETPGISHVGIYVGDGMMIHCGNPIGYASVNTPYWQAHFYGFARP